MIEEEEEEEDMISEGDEAELDRGNEIEQGWPDVLRLFLTSRRGRGE